MAVCPRPSALESPKRFQLAKPVVHDDDDFDHDCDDSDGGGKNILPTLTSAKVVVGRRRKRYESIADLI